MERDHSAMDAPRRENRARRPAGLEARAHPDLQFPPAVVDDHGVQEPYGVHTDQQDGLASELPVIKYAHVPIGHARTLDADVPESDRRGRIGLTVLLIVGHPEHLFGMRLAGLVMQHGVCLLYTSPSP